MKTKIITLFVLLCLATAGFSQNYNTGIGIRGGYYNGLTIKHFTSHNTAFEGLITSRWGGVELTGLYEKENNFPGMERLSGYVGFGAHVGFWNGDNTYSYWGNQGTQYVVIGLDGILGLEYSFMFLPVNISLDWKPELNLIGYTGFWYDGGALSIRYIF
jgi:hypothetical protein